MESNTGKCSNVGIMGRWNDGVTKCSNDNALGCLNNEGACSSHKTAELLDDETAMKGSSDEMAVEGLNDEAEKHPSDEAAGGSSNGAVGRLSDKTVKDNTATECSNDDMRDNGGSREFGTFEMILRRSDPQGGRQNIQMGTGGLGTNEIIS